MLDFGCGIGRLSKALVEKYDCHVLGVDISPDMRRMAQDYVGSDRFSVISYEMFCALAETGSLQTDCAIAVYVLQHVYDPAHDIGLLEKAVRDIDSENGAKTFYLDEQPEPSADVGLLLAEHFEQQRQLELAADKISVVDKHWCRIYGKKESK